MPENFNPINSNDSNFYKFDRLKKEEAEVRKKIIQKNISIGKTAKKVISDLENEELKKMKKEIEEKNKLIIDKNNKINKIKVNEQSDVLEIITLKENIEEIDKNLAKRKKVYNSVLEDYEYLEKEKKKCDTIVKKICPDYKFLFFFMLILMISSLITLLCMYKDKFFSNTE
tara:strand:+ start:4133 stop:4645 length:513 start_codon:yes stop_codon:yes gene_type:complete